MNKRLNITTGAYREMQAHEILIDGELKELFIFGANEYITLLSQPSDQIDTAVVDMPQERGFRGMRLMEKILSQPDFEASNWPRVADSSASTNGETVTQVILGDTPREGDTISQLVIRSSLLPILAENRMIESLAYKRNPEYIIVDRGFTTVRYKLSLTTRTIRQSNRHIQILDTTGIEIRFDDNGMPQGIYGITFKGRVPHFTDELMGSKIKRAAIPDESLNKLHKLCIS